VGAVHGFVIVANRLPVDEVVDEVTGSTEWRPSPGGLVTALLPVMRSADGAWVGWTGAAGDAPEPFEADGLRLVPVGLTDAEVADYYAGFANATLWPLYHDAIVAPEFHRAWWQTYQQVNQRFADAAAATAADAATVWVHDYQLQLVPAMLRAARPDLRIGFFNHIPFPGYEIFAQLPWRRQIIEGLVGADLLGFQRHADVTNFLRACRRAANMTTRGRTVHVPPAAPERRHGAAALTSRETSATQDRTRVVRAAAFPIAIDTAALEGLARREDVRARAREIRDALGDPRLILLGVDRLDYTKGILHRLKAYGELLDEGRLKPPEAVLVQVASPSRERVEHYQRLRVDVEATVGRINGDHGLLGHPAIHYLHQSYPREEMAALYLAADLMLVTSLRDGMNLVAKEYVACRIGDSGALVLSEFTGAADELTGAFLVNPHDIDGLKDTIEQAALVSPAEARRRMRSMRRRVTDNDVARWAAGFLDALRAAPPAIQHRVPRPRQSRSSRDQ
jgi:alpha,alpha-trehalose-phosphate synthase [UDP-forming]